MSIRTTTRISTRNRALNGCDYEKMILERFDDIEKVCCIPVAKDSSDVRIVVFPHPEKRVLPQLPNWKLAEIEQYIKSFVNEENEENEKNRNRTVHRIGSNLFNRFRICPFRYFWWKDPDVHDGVWSYGRHCFLFLWWIWNCGKDGRQDRQMGLAHRTISI